MDELIRQIRAALGHDLYYVALHGALTLPDLCGALESKNGRATGPKYKAWLKANVPRQANQAEEIYGLRCSLLHQGHATPKGGVPVAFMAPDTGQLHNLSTVAGEDQVGWLSIEMFVAEVTAGAERWLQKYGETGTVERNLEKFARLRPDGIPGHVKGPVIA